MKLASVLVSLALVSSIQLNAMGDREQGALIGVGSLLILNSLFNNNVRNEPTVVYRDEPRRYDYYAPSYRPYKEVIIIERDRPRHHIHRYNEYDSYRRYR